MLNLNKRNREAIQTTINKMPEEDFQKIEKQCAEQVLDKYVNQRQAIQNVRSNYISRNVKQVQQVNFIKQLRYLKEREQPRRKSELHKKIKLYRNFLKRMDKKDKRKWKFKLKKKSWKQKYFDRTKNKNNFLSDKEKEKIRWEQNP